MPSNFQGITWLLFVLAPFLIFQRRLHRELQAVLLLLTRRCDITLVIFSILLLPGIFLHETSHFLVARILGVKTGRLSLIPKPLPDGRLQLGFLETAPTDLIREALIGLAPLVTGGSCVAYFGIHRLHLVELFIGLKMLELSAFFMAVDKLITQQDFWLWFYLIVTVSSTMLPSVSDRRSWLPVGIIMIVFLAVVLIAGAGPWLVGHVAEPLNSFLMSVALVFSISLVTHLVMLAPIWGLHNVLSRLTGLQVN